MVTVMFAETSENFSKFYWDYSRKPKLYSQSIGIYLFSAFPIPEVLGSNCIRGIGYTEVFRGYILTPRQMPC
jgi:hypothetical protein